MNVPLYQLTTRFYCWLILKVAKRAGDVQLFAILIAVTRIRIEFELPFPGEDEVLDHSLMNTVRAYFRIERKDSNSILGSQNAKFWEWLQADPSSNNDCKTYFRVSHWFATATDNDAEAEDISSAYQTLFVEDLEPIETSEIWRSRSEFRQRFRTEFRKLRESKAQAFTLTLQEFTPLIPWISVSFVIAGYLHTYWVYSSFGIDVSQFFSINDYLGNSIEEIHHTLTGLASFFLGGMHGWRNSPTWTPSEIERLARREKWDIVLAIVVLTAVLYMWHMGTTIQGFTILVSVCVFAIIRNRLFRLVSKYVKNSQQVFVVVMFVGLFLSSLFLSAILRVGEIKHASSRTSLEIKTGSQYFTPDNSVFIGANSRYIFLLVENGNIEIIPIGKAEKMQISIPRKDKMDQLSNLGRIALPL